MRRALFSGLTVLAVSVGGSFPADAGLFDRLVESFGGSEGPVVVQSGEPALPGPSLEVPRVSAAQVDEPPPVPIPDSPAMESSATPIELYPCVSYDDRDEMHPCAVETIVGVPDPSSVKHPFYWLVGDAPPEFCSTGCGTCACCLKPQVYVLVCVPPECPMPEPRISHNGRHYTYDFGKYSVAVKLQRGAIEVEYDD